jgi:acyl-CoA synthetase (AMP-forming)/AMP-acid ligase II
MWSRMTRRHRHCVQARRLLFTYTMATIQPSFANAAKFFNSLLEGESIKVLDDDGNEVAAGTIGKIYARHFATSRFTYINRESDRKAIEHDGYVTVGDIGYVDDEGYLYVSDRRTDLVLSGGVNIYPAEIEQALIGMPGVADCAVFGVPDAEFGQSLVAAVQAHEEKFLTAQQVQNFLSKKFLRRCIGDRIQSLGLQLPTSPPATNQNNRCGHRNVDDDVRPMAITGQTTSAF